MADIERIKVGDTTYDVKDALFSPRYTNSTSPVYCDNVPANGRRARIGMIGGKTVGWNQLEYGQTTVLNGSTTSGVTFTTENGYTKLNGTASAYITNCYFDRTTLEQNTVGGHKYFLWGCSKNSGTYYLEPLVGSGGDFCYGHPHERGDGVIFESKKTDGTLTFLYGIRLEIGAGSTFSNTRINCYLADLTKMFGSGNEPTSLTDSRISFIKAYASANPSYNAGTLLSAKTDAVKSVGANVWDEEFELGDRDGNTGAKKTGTYVMSKNPISVLPSTQYYIYSANEQGDTNRKYIIYQFDANGNFISPYIQLFSNADTFSTYSNTAYIYFRNNKENSTTYNHDIQICLNSYSEKTAYHPYKSDSFPIPSAVKSLAGYGQSAGSVYNYVDVETKTYRNMKSVDLATLTWGGSAGAWTTTLAGYAGSPLHASIPNTAFSYSGTTLTVASTASPTGILHYQASDSTGTDYEARLFHKRVGSVDLGNFDYSYNGMFNQFQSTVLVGAKSNTGYEKANIICVKYETESAVNAYIVGQTRKLISLGGNGKIEIYDSTYYDATAFKTAMSGVYLFYELATEQILDVTSYFSGDVFIEVENGGTVEFHQEGNVQLEIPNKLTYLTQGSEVMNPHWVTKKDVGLNNALTYQQCIPTEPNKEGGLKVVVLSKEPAQKYAGWIYLITG